MRLSHNVGWPMVKLWTRQSIALPIDNESNAVQRAL